MRATSRARRPAEKSASAKRVAKKRFQRSAPRKHRIDPITAEVIRGAMETVAFEMAMHVSLAAVTPILNQSNERNASILDSDGRLAALSVGIPQFMLASRGPVRFALEFFGKEGFHTGDVFAANDPYHGGGHLPDWNIFAPVVVGGELVLIASIQCHHGDTGGDTPGGYSVNAVDVWAEGLRVPAIKLVEEGVERKDVLYLLRTNNRLPTHGADLKAQMGAATLGARRLTELVESYGVPTIRAAVQYSIDLTKKQLKREIASWPDGVYEGLSILEQDTRGNRDIKIHCKATVAGDQLTLDYSGSDRRSNLTTNGTFGNTQGMVLSQLCTMLDPSIPKNEGLFEAMELIVPKGTCINPEETRPVSAGTHHPGVEVSEALCLALSQAVPDRAQPQTYKIAIPTVIFGNHPQTGAFFVDQSVDTTSTCACASSAGDGWGATPTAFGNLILSTAEINESLLPHRQMARDLITDSGGPGFWRGQPGARYVKEVTSDCQVYTWVLGAKTRVPGVAGGQPGSVNRVFLRQGGPAAYEVKHTAFYVGHKAGEQIIVDFASGSGWGDPFDRPAERVLEDVLDEYVSVEGAARDYGVVIEGDLEALALTVNQAATESLREQMRCERAEALARGPVDDAPTRIASVEEWFDRRLPWKLRENPDLTGGFNGTFAFNVSGEVGGQWSVTIQGAEATVTPGLSPEAAFTLSCSAENFVGMTNGEVDGMQLFMNGQLGFEGDMNVSMGLQGLLF